MDGWNFLDGSSTPRNVLRKGADKVNEVSVREQMDRIRRIIAGALRDYPDAYRAVVDALHEEHARECSSAVSPSTRGT